MSTGEQSGLPKLLGYAELEAEFGWKKRTLQEWVRKKKLKPPGIYPGGKAAWHLEDILAFAETLRQGLKRAAVTDAADLAPEQLEEQALDLAAQAWSKRAGMPIELGQILTLVADERDFDLLEREVFEYRVARLSALPVDDAVKLVATLLPQLRHVLRAAVSGIDLEDGAVVPGAVLDLVSFLIQADRKARLSFEQVPDSFGELSERLTVYGLERAIILSAWFFPALRPMMRAGTNGTDPQLFTDEAILKKLAWVALDDERWSATKHKSIARQHSQAEGGRGPE